MIVEIVEVKGRLMTSSNIPQPLDKAIQRDQFETILRAALSLDELRFARQIALTWLAHYPGDLPVNLLYARVLLKSGRPDQAIQILERICRSDPEYLEAVEALWSAQSLHQSLEHSINPKSNTHSLSNVLGWLLALGGDPNRADNFIETPRSAIIKSDYSWSKALAKSRYALGVGHIEQAEQEILPALAANVNCPLVNVTHLKIVRSRLAENGAGFQMVRSLAAYYHQRIPECLACSLILAEALMDSGQMEQGVALLHGAAAQDITGQVAERLWGKNHPYTDLYPSSPEIQLELPLPALITDALGWNRLPAHINVQFQPSLPIVQPGVENQTEVPTQVEEVHLTDKVAEPNPENQTPETLRSVREELQRLSARLNRPALAQADGRFPVYVVMSTRKGLENKFDPSTADVIEAEMLRLVASVQQRKDWSALLFYADTAAIYRSDKNNPVQLKRSPVRPDDPWGIKLALQDLNEALKKRGERIGALLIVGGPDVVPFHQLPNPVDDADNDVASDNPYGTSDENYFIPEWAVGRLPDGTSVNGGNAQSLLYLLSGLTTRHQNNARNQERSTWYKRWFDSLFVWLKNRGPLPKSVRQSFGYTAAIWRQASISVFRPIGEPSAMYVSPPLVNKPNISSPSSNGHHAAPLPASRLGYFNLHGLIDAPEWYGQRDSGTLNPPGVIGEGDDYPIALRPSDVVNSGRAPQVVFTEACYGAHILNKSVDEALSLKFLQAGTQAIIGSTCISYGAISPPLIAADYLGHAFWSYLREGLPAGEALLRAKISLAREMHNRQGYLDGEDQKTLISFVLYGDPLATPTGLVKTVKSYNRSVRLPFQIKTVCDLAHDEANQPIPADILDYVKNVVEQYLPGMEGARLTLSNEHINCEFIQPKSAYHCTSFEATPGKKRDSQSPYHLARKVVTLSKQVPNTTHIHQHYARITLDAEGKLVKLVVSR